jgi:hypothetical protein
MEFHTYVVHATATVINSRNNINQLVFLKGGELCSL